MVNKPAFEHVDELVVALGVGGQNEKPGIHQVAQGVEYNSLHDLAVEELQPHPDAVDDRRAGVEIQVLVLRVSFKAVYIENGLDILY